MIEFYLYIAIAISLIFSSTTIAMLSYILMRKNNQVINLEKENKVIKDEIESDDIFYMKIIINQYEYDLLKKKHLDSQPKPENRKNDQGNQSSQPQAQTQTNTHTQKAKVKPPQSMNSIQKDEKSFNTIIDSIKTREKFNSIKSSLPKIGN